MGTKETIFAYVGSYAEPEGSGVYACRFDADTGSLTLVNEIGNLKNPTFLDVDVQRLTVYALGEEQNADGSKYGIAVSFDMDRNTGALTQRNKAVTTPAPTCHLVLDKSRQVLMVSSYHGGMIGMNPLLPDGSIGHVSDVRRHEGRSVLPVQSQARAHSVTVDPNNRFAVVCDLGLDKLFLYRLDLEAQRFVWHGEVSTAPGAGPRHFVFHPEGFHAYVINELNATITAYSYDEYQGRLRELQTVSTLPEGYEGPNACADIHISPDGRFLYGSNRGHDSIVVYRIDSVTGRLEYIEHVSTLGEHPRNFALSPDGRFVLIANRDTNNIVTFRRDAESGRLTAAGTQFEVSKPVCIKFAVLGGNG
jgi:6-phosphogluconolactonase